MPRAFAVAFWLCLILAGCGSRLSGKYQVPNGMISVEFSSRKAYLTVLGETVECEYELKDDKIVIRVRGESLVMTRNQDGSIEGPMGRLTKAKS